MIYEIARELDAELASRGVPLRVEYGPEERRPTTIARSRIVLERDRQGGDVVGPPRSEHRNPRLVGVRAVGCVLRIYAQSTLDGAGVHDHERLADQAADKVHVALRKVVTRRKTLWEVTSAKLLSAAELELLGLERWPGVVYELRFRIDRGVFDTTWTSDADPTAALGGIASVTRINGAETACGA